MQNRKYAKKEWGNKLAWNSVINQLTNPERKNHYLHNMYAWNWIKSMLNWVQAPVSCWLSERMAKTETEWEK